MTLYNASLPIKTGDILLSNYFFHVTTCEIWLV